MSIVPPFHDVSVAGCLAGASLSATAKSEAAAKREAATFAPAPMCAQAPAPQTAPCRARQRRLLGALFSLVSGPTMPRGGANTT